MTSVFPFQNVMARALRRNQQSGFCLQWHTALHLKSPETGLWAICYSWFEVCIYKCKVFWNPMFGINKEMWRGEVEELVNTTNKRFHCTKYRQGFWRLFRNSLCLKPSSVFSSSEKKPKPSHSVIGCPPFPTPPLLLLSHFIHQHQPNQLSKRPRKTRHMRLPQGFRMGPGWNTSPMQHLVTFSPSAGLPPNATSHRPCLAILDYTEHR